MNKLKLLKKCRICLEEKLFCKPMFKQMLEKYMPSLIEYICGVHLLEQDEGNAVVCIECAMALIQADIIKRKFISTQEILRKQKENLNHDLKEEDTKEQYIDQYIEWVGDNESVEVDADENDNVDACNAAQPNKNRRLTLNHYRRVKNGKRSITINRVNDLHFCCKLCPFESDFVKYFRNHMRDVHKVERPEIFKCQHCWKSYEYHKTLQTHVARVHECTPPLLNFLCSECGKAFSGHSHLVRHSYVHNRDKMPFRCEVCSKLFASRSNMQRHLLAHHSDDKPFVCEICEKKFGDFYVLKYHKKQVHKSM